MQLACVQVFCQAPLPSCTCAAASDRTRPFPKSTPPTPSSLSTVIPSRALCNTLTNRRRFSSHCPRIARDCDGLREWRTSDARRPTSASSARRTGPPTPRRRARLVRPMP
ncbi:hypothetical protein DAEQUDRAFT_30348 [Daedalea quercina L-15889]|uniref:Uncharacterized protein n=1 Tax=Daedalea quercina L-15889 TaxID=1314783 RepID=A0A165SPW4_9APHY|nr:hypothetical protein DAEQUDRAFT_30348 [Daedalea quercina L-15889]